ncbi:hypothetical protein ACFSL6_01405 [Paenibacillus thailandensis]|uniref:Uncharacterized protein n=1 Tax=Paenibacillus thailandensis TaxID=393250 RepID=A0ABW5R5P8_9BACL
MIGTWPAIWDITKVVKSSYATTAEDPNKIEESHYIFTFNEATGKTDVKKVDSKIQNIEGIQPAATAAAAAGSVLVSLIQVPIEGASELEVRSKILDIEGSTP